ncbi:MAG: hypothetical protein PHD04_03375 [Candidatus Pacebacteria bacterium]|nr:hypothetical protein [Candidatus Paceibacterota bacterium]
MDTEKEILEFQKRRKKKMLLVTDGNERIEKTLEMLSENILNTMKNHIGYENAISVSELFKKVYKKDIKEFNIYKRLFYWSILKKLIHLSRKECFIIISKNRVYVLKSEEELNSLRNKIKRVKEGLDNMQISASNWVASEKWRNL